MQQTSRSSPRVRRHLDGPNPDLHPGSWAFRVALALVFAGPARAQGFELISISSTGTASNGECLLGNGSANGRYIAFDSSATNLVAGDTNGASQDVFVRDRLLQTTELVSRWSDGSQGQWAGGGSVSDDGRYVAFEAQGMYDSGGLYRRDRVAPTTTGLTPGSQLTVDFSRLSSSGDGNFIAYYQERLAFDSILIGVASLAPGVPAWLGQVGSTSAFTLRLGPLSRDGRFVPYGVRWNPGAGGNGSYMTVSDRSTSTQFSSFMAPGPSVALVPLAISSAGRYLVYWQSGAPASLRFRDLQTGSDEQLDVTLDGSPTTQALSASVSDDGRWVAFVSPSDALVLGDTNGVSDAFLRDRLLQKTTRVSVDASGGQFYAATRRAWLAPAGDSLLLDTRAPMLPIDTNPVSDIYRLSSVLQYPDADLDTFGGGIAQWRPLPISAGWTLVGGDCDDNDPARNPSTVETCNGIDDDCDGLVDEGLAGQSYCATNVTPNFCAPRIIGSGCPQVSRPSGFSLTAQDLQGNRSGLIAYSSGSQQVPFASGNPSTLCLQAPIQRTNLQSSGGTPGQCDGSFSLDFLAWVASQPGALHTPLVAGTTLHFQAYVREPAYPKGACLTDGWRVTLEP